MTEQCFRIQGIAMDCAASVYGKTPPSDEYARRVAALLVGTAAVESAFIHRRQIGFSWTNTGGGWSLWQLEAGSIHDSLKYLGRREDLHRRCEAWLLGPGGEGQMPWLLDSMLARSSRLYHLQAVAVSDRLACLFARLHYMRFPDPVPAAEKDRAIYWKQFYNTAKGAGTTDRYIEAIRSLVHTQSERE